MSDESHAGMSLAKALLEKFGSVPAALAAAETMERSDVWVFVTFDEDDPETPINATGFWPDEHGAFLAGEEYVRQWEERAREDAREPGVFCKPIPLFIERSQIDAD